MRIDKQNQLELKQRSSQDQFWIDALFEGFLWVLQSQWIVETNLSGKFKLSDSVTRKKSPNVY